MPTRTWRRSPPSGSPARRRGQRPRFRHRRQAGEGRARPRPPRQRVPRRHARIGGKKPLIVELCSQRFWDLAPARCIRRCSTRALCVRNVRCTGHWANAAWCGTSPGRSPVTGSTRSPLGGRRPEPARTWDITKLAGRPAVALLLTRSSTSSSRAGDRRLGLAEGCLVRRPPTTPGRCRDASTASLSPAERGPCSPAPPPRSNAWGDLVTPFAPGVGHPFLNVGAHLTLALRRRINGAHIASTSRLKRAPHTQVAADVDRATPARTFPTHQVACRSRTAESGVAFPDGGRRARIGVQRRGSLSAGAVRAPPLSSVDSRDAERRTRERPTFDRSQPDFENVSDQIAVRVAGS